MGDGEDGSDRVVMTLASFPVSSPKANEGSADDGSDRVGRPWLDFRVSALGLKYTILVSIDHRVRWRLQLGNKESASSTDECDALS